MPALDTIAVDTHAYQVHFLGFHRPLEVRLRSGAAVSLRPWTCHAHLGALGRHLRPGPSGLELDVPAFCGEVLADSGLGELSEELGPLALWWAAGGAERPASPGPEGWLELGGRRVQIRPWTHGERLKALGDSVRLSPDGRAAFDIEAYLRAMLQASIQAWAPVAGELHELDAASTAAVLEAVVTLNISDGQLESVLAERLRLGTQEVAATTLRLCRALGWTPSQVWAAPAAEIDRLVALLDAVEAPVGHLPAPRLADHPDAVVIRIEEPA